jgi:hypothetical protein
MELIDAAHPRYDEYRALFNGMTDKRPGLIARCGTPGDVAAILQRAGPPGTRSRSGRAVTRWRACQAMTAVWSSTSGR